MYGWVSFQIHKIEIGELLMVLGNTLRSNIDSDKAWSNLITEIQNWDVDMVSDLEIVKCAIDRISQSIQDSYINEIAYNIVISDLRRSKNHLKSRPEYATWGLSI